MYYAWYTFSYIGLEVSHPKARIGGEGENVTREERNRKEFLWLA